jgi:hypothetical protein
MTRATAVLATLGALLALPTAAGAQDAGSRQAAKLKFTTKQPGTPSGLVFKVDYVNPADPAAKPPAVRRVVETLARGARFDTSAPESCTAPDPQLMLLGTGACPAGSAVGTGHLTLDTGLPDPGRIVDVEIDFFNNANELIFLNQPGPLDSPRVVVRAALGERRAVSEAPFLPGTPPDGAAIDTVSARFQAVTRTIGGERHSYVTTPPRCPKRGYWVNRAAFTYFDGVSQTVRSRSRCKAG